MFLVILVSLLITLAAAQDLGCTGSLATSNGAFKLSWTSPMDGYLRINASAENDDGTWMAIGASFTNNMPNSDIVIGAVSGDESFIEDRWATTRTRPVLDTTQSFMSESINREDGVTTLVFTRKLNTGDDQDLRLDDEQCFFFIWAMGGPVTDYGDPAVFGFHTAQGNFGAARVCLQDCALDDDDNNDDDDDDDDGCTGSLATSNGAFILSWTSPMDGYLRINASAENDDGTWMAIGASFTNNMPNSDIVIGAVSGDESFIEDRWATTRTRPALDTTQSFMGESIERYDGVTTLAFTRKLNTGDDQDLRLDDEQCFFFIWAMGGPVTDYGDPAVFGFHTAQGNFGAERVCLQDCALDDDSGSGTVMVSFASLIVATVITTAFFL